MRPVKRIEIIVPEPATERLLAALEQVGTAGVTIVPQAFGAGDRPMSSWNPMTNENESRMVITSVAEHDLVRLVDIIRPILTRFGGTCMVSDAMWVIH